MSLDGQPTEGTGVEEVFYLDSAKEETFYRTEVEKDKDATENNSKN